jgi:DNA primase
MVELVNRFPSCEFIVWLDGDQAGMNAAYNIKSRLSLLCSATCIYTKKDPKAYTTKEIRKILNRR